MSLVPTIRLSMEMTDVLCDIERSGLKINLDTLEEIEDQYRQELLILEGELRDLAQEAMGDTPVNLNSPDDKSRLFYSRAVLNKGTWKSIFNLGTEIRGATAKPKMRPRMTPREFAANVSRNTKVVYKTRAEHCSHCAGTGRFSPPRKDGSPGKAVRICTHCNGAGVIYHNTNEVAGFKMIPRNPMDVASAGFRTDRETLENFFTVLTGEARVFVEKYIRYNALRTYLSTFVEGMKTFREFIKEVYDPDSDRDWETLLVEL